jgi:DNA-binding MarR family transcriptional regulator
MDQEELRPRITHEVLRFIAAVVLHNQEVAAREGIGASDGQVLSLLNVNGPMTPGQIATVTGLSTGSVTSLLDRLERGGLIRRVRDAQDRRKVRVEPDPEGQRRLSRHYDDYGTHLAAVLDGLSADELRAVLGFFTAVNAVDGYIAAPPDSSSSSSSSSS